MKLIFLVLLVVFLSGCVEGASDFVLKKPEQEIATDHHLQNTRSGLAYDSSPLIADFSYGYRSNGGQGPSRSLQNGSELHSGDYYKIQFTPKEACHVYIFQYDDSSHQLFTLFPPDPNYFIGADWDNKNPVKAGRTYFVPGEAKSFILAKENKRINETIHFLVSKKSKPQLEKHYKALLQSQKQGDRRGAERAQTGINEYIRKAPEPQVRFDDGSIVKPDQERMFKHVQGRRLECQKEYCVESITFTHLP